MKQLLLLTLLAFINVNPNFAQEKTARNTTPKTITPAKTFNNDKEAFIKNNFTIENKKCRDVPVALFLEEISKEYPYYFVIDETNTTLNRTMITRIIVYFYSRKEMTKAVKEERKILTAVVEFNEFIHNTNTKYQGFKKLGTNKLLKWDKDKYTFLLNQVTVQSTSSVYLLERVESVLYKPGEIFVPQYNW